MPIYGTVYVPNVVRFSWELWGLGDLDIEACHLVVAGNSRFWKEFHVEISENWSL